MVVLPNIVEMHTACEALPLFPLPGSVFLPHTVLPLHVFEKRYQALINDVMQTNRILAVPRLKPGWESNYERTPEIFPVCGLGQIVHHEPLGDGRSNIAILGLGRARVRAEVAGDAPYRIASAMLLEDRLPDRGMAAVERLTGRLRMMLAQILSQHPDLQNRLGPLLDEPPEPIPFVNALAHLVLADVDARQAYIEIDDVEARIDCVESLLAGTLSLGVARA